MWEGGQGQAPAALHQEKIWYPFCRRLSGPQGRSGRVGKKITQTGFRYLDRPARSE